MDLKVYKCCSPNVSKFVNEDFAKCILCKCLQCVILQCKWPYGPFVLNKLIEDRFAMWRKKESATY